MTALNTIDVGTQGSSGATAMSVGVQPRRQGVPAPATARGIVEVTGLHKTYGRIAAVQDVSFSVGEGEIFGILGPNGAGKTTTVECISGLRRHEGGTITVLGLDPQRDRDALREVVGVQLQEGSMRSELKVWELVHLFASFYRNPRDETELIDLLGLTPKRNASYRSLSGGQKQRLSVALALIGNPRIAILDELTTGLDPQARRDTWELIEQVRDQDVTILLVTHFMDEAERLCDRVAIVDKGRVIAMGTPTGLAQREGGGNHMRFQPSQRFDESVIAGLPGINRVERQGSRVVVSGTGDLVNRVTQALGAIGVQVDDIQLESATLEDAFVRLTSRPRVVGRSDQS